MKILAFDGTARAASVAMLDGERVLGYYTIDNGLTQSELLLPMAENLLESLKLSFGDVELYATSVGPGSFTGVRIGVSLIKGLAFGKGLPCAEVSTLEALAENAATLKGIIVPYMDARRAQVYSATFRSDGEMTLTVKAGPVQGEFAVRFFSAGDVEGEFEGKPCRVETAVDGEMRLIGQMNREDALDGKLVFRCRAKKGALPRFAGVEIIPR